MENFGNKSDRNRFIHGYVCGVIYLEPLFVAETQDRTARNDAEILELSLNGTGIQRIQGI